MSTQTNYKAMSIEELMTMKKPRSLCAQRQIYGYIGHRRAARDAILDMAEELDADGLVVVPRKATQNMLNHVWWQCEDDGHQAEAWEAMIAAAPPPSRG